MRQACHTTVDAGGVYYVGSLLLGLGSQTVNHTYESNGSVSVNYGTATALQRRSLTLSCVPLGARCIRCHPGAFRGLTDQNHCSASRGIRIRAPHKAAPPPQLALPAMVAIATARLVGAPALMTTRAPECAHLDAKKFRQLSKSAQRGGEYMSHTDRYRRDVQYRLVCLGHSPPTPEWLQYPYDGVGARRRRRICPALGALERKFFLAWALIGTARCVQRRSYLRKLSFSSTRCGYIYLLTIANMVTAGERN